MTDHERIERELRDAAEGITVGTGISSDVRRRIKLRRIGMAAGSLALVAALAVGSTFAAGALTPDTNKVHPARPNEPSVLIDYKRVGGFEGSEFHLTIEADGDAVLRSGEGDDGYAVERRLSSDEMVRLAAAIDAVDWPAADNEHEPPEGLVVADGYQHELRHDGHVVLTESGANPPKEITALVRYLDGFLNDRSASEAPKWVVPDVYRYEVASTCGERDFFGHFRIEVRDGKVTDVAGLDESARAGIEHGVPIPSLEELLKQAEAIRDEGVADLVEVEYDSIDGHPTKIKIDYYADGVDDEACYEITAYEEQQEEKASGGPPDDERCTDGIEGKGTSVSEHYPPRPYFEVFNLWGTEVPGGCLVAAAGQQRTHDSNGEDDPNRYAPEGMLMIFGDDRTKGSIDLVKTPLVGPIRITGASGSGYSATLLLQSLADCQEALFKLRKLDFKEATASLSSGPCPNKDSD